MTNPKNAGPARPLARELCVLVPLVALALFMGVASPLFTRTIEPAVAVLVEQVRSRQQGPPPPARAAVDGGSGGLRRGLRGTLRCRTSSCNPSCPRWWWR